MKVILMYVMSLDGKITKWSDGNAAEWASPEDTALFRKTITESDVLIMGGATYRAIRPAPQQECLRVVLTRNPSAYMGDTVPGQLEFTDEAPKEVVEQLVHAGHRQVLLVGGGGLATSFLKEKLVDELWVTIEPRLFGVGLPVVAAEQLDIALTLLEFSQLNAAGTLLLKYTLHDKD